MSDLVVKMPRIVCNMRRLRTRAGRSLYPTVSARVAATLHFMWTADISADEAAKRLGLSSQVVGRWFDGFASEEKAKKRGAGDL